MNTKESPKASLDMWVLPGGWGTKHSPLPFSEMTLLWTRSDGSIPETYNHPPDHREGQYLTLF